MVAVNMRARNMAQTMTDVKGQVIEPAPGEAAQKGKPPENYGKESRATVAAFLPWRGLPARSP